MDRFAPGSCPSASYAVQLARTAPSLAGPGRLLLHGGPCTSSVLGKPDRRLPGLSGEVACTGEYGAACFRARAGSLPDVSGWPLFGEGIRAFDGVATAHYLQEQAAFLSEALRE